MFQPDPEAFNTWEHPDVNVPRRNDKTKMEKGLLTAILRPESWNVLRFSRK